MFDLRWHYKGPAQPRPSPEETPTRQCPKPHLIAVGSRAATGWPSLRMQPATFSTGALIGSGQLDCLYPH